MAKHLTEILKMGVKSSEKRPGSTGSDPGVDYKSKSSGDQEFVAKHETEVHADRVGNRKVPYKSKKKEVEHDKQSPDVYESKSLSEEDTFDSSHWLVHAKTKAPIRVGDIVKDTRGNHLKFHGIKELPSASKPEGVVHLSNDSNGYKMERYPSHVVAKIVPKVKKKD
jgi:hypothetical protein